MIREMSRKVQELCDMNIYWPCHKSGRERKYQNLNPRAFIQHLRRVTDNDSLMMVDMFFYFFLLLGIGIVTSPEVLLKSEKKCGG